MEGEEPMGTHRKIPALIDIWWRIHSCLLSYLVDFVHLKMIFFLHLFVFIRLILESYFWSTSGSLRLVGKLLKLWLSFSASSTEFLWEFNVVLSKHLLPQRTTGLRLLVPITIINKENKRYDFHDLAYY